MLAARDLRERRWRLADTCLQSLQIAFKIHRVGRDRRREHMGRARRFRCHWWGCYENAAARGGGIGRRDLGRLRHWRERMGFLFDRLGRLEIYGRGIPTLSIAILVLVTRGDRRLWLHENHAWIARVTAALRP